MIMNKIEFALMNNPVRRFIQAHLEVIRMKKIAKLPPGAPRVLEIGCGSGFGTRLIKKHFQPDHIDAVDLDEKMIRIAKRKNRDMSVSFSVGDAAKLDFPENSFDAVFDFGIIHHIPNWQDCLNELHRVLKPHGVVVAEDLSIETFSTLFGKILRRILAHPYKEMFTREQFLGGLKKAGFTITAHLQYGNLGLMPYFVIAAKKKP